MTTFRAWAVCGALAGVFCLAVPSSAMAQLIQLDPQITDTAPTVSPHMSLSQPPDRRPVTEQADRRREGTAPDEVAAPTDVLVPLRPVTVRAGAQTAIRLSGEAAQARFILFLPQDADGAELRIAHRTGIDALPERSSLQVIVNDVDIGAVRPDNFSDFGRDTLPVPDGVLQAGRNIVELRVRQSHRVACGPDASFALWTEIDTTNSGVLMPADSFGADPVGFLAAVAAQAARGQAITVRRPDPDASLLDAAPFIGQVSAALGGTPPEIESAPYWVQAPARPELARLTALPQGEGLAQPRFMRGGDGAIVLLVERDSDYAAISASLMDMVQPLAAPQLAQVTPGREQTLAELGTPRLMGQGRYILMPVDFALPWNWALLASQKAQLVLDYRFAPNLPEGALLLVKVNGTPVRMLPLDRAGGERLPSLPIAFGANLLRAGANRLEFEALIPGDPPHMACPPMEGPVLEISEGSRLFVPQSPSMLLPSVDMSLAMLAPQNILATPRAAQQLAPGVVPQIASALIQPQWGNGPRSPHVRLTVGTTGDLPDLYDPLGGEALRALQDALSLDIIRPVADTAPATAWDMVDRAPGLFSLPRLGAVAEWPAQLRQTGAALLFGDTAGLVDWLHGQEAQAALVQPDPHQPEHIWLIFAPHATPSTIIQSLAASRDAPTGQVALFIEGEGWRSWTNPQRPLILQEPVSASNLRAVLGNYATLSPWLFLGVVLSLATLSAGIALMILKITRKPEQ